MENQSRRKRRINILKKLRADYSRDELCILFREAMMDDGDDDDDAGAVVAEETVVRLPQSVGPKKGRMTFVESVCDVISFASLEKNQADQWKFLTDDISSVQHEGSFTKKLRLIANKPDCFNQDAFQILQNIQEVRNNYRVPRYRDELTLKTE